MFTGDSSEKLRIAPRPSSNRHHPFSVASSCQISSFQNAPHRQPDTSDTDKYFVDFEFTTVDGRLKTVPLRRDLSEGEMKKELLLRGYSCPTGRRK